MNTNDQVVAYIRKLRLATYVKTALFIFGFVVVYTFLFYEKDLTKDDHIAVIKISGEISDDSPRTSALTVLGHIDRAVKNGKAKAILIEMNSGGGSPVQAESVHEELLRLRDMGDVKIVVSVKEICASACLYIASAADTVYVHNSSLMGSIGVIMGFWDVSQLSDKIGLKRRSFSIGSHKEFVNAFSEPDPAVTEHIETVLLPPLFEQFKEALVLGRGDKLQVDDDRLFTGLLWTGSDTVKIGLADDVKSTYSVRKMLSEQYATTNFIDYTKVKKLSVRNLFSSDFWAEVVLKVANESHAEIVF